MRQTTIELYFAAYPNCYPNIEIEGFARGKSGKLKEICTESQDKDDAWNIGLTTDVVMPCCVLPVHCWSTNTIIAMTVHLRFSPTTPLVATSCICSGLPLKQSAYVDVMAYKSSSLIVSQICSHWSFTSTVGPPRCMRTFSASSYWPLCTSHQDDSGTNGRPIKSMTGKIHWGALERRFGATIDAYKASLTMAVYMHKDLFCFWCSKWHHWTCCGQWHLMSIF